MGESPQSPWADSLALPWMSLVVLGLAYAAALCSLHRTYGLTIRTAEPLPVAA